MLTLGILYGVGASFTCAVWLDAWEKRGFDWKDPLLIAAYPFWMFPTLGLWLWLPIEETRR